MKLFTPVLAAMLVSAIAGNAAAQNPESSPAQPAAPRVELGAAFTGALPLSTDSDGFGVLPMPTARVGVALNSRWAIEGAFDIWPEPNNSTVVYRAQARWQLHAPSAPGSLQTHLTFGGAGWVSYQAWPERRWQDRSGTMHVNPARSIWDVGPPIFPTVGVGFQKTVRAHLALRADVTAVVVPADDFVTVVLMPSFGVSIPIGRYAARAR